MNFSYFLISVPKKSSDPNETDLKEMERCLKSMGDRESRAWEWELPGLRVGNIDSLIFLSDALKKTSVTVEGILKKLAAQFFELKAEGNEKKKTPIMLEVNHSRPEEFLTRFKWEESRYPKSKPLSELAQTIKGAVGTIEKELRELSAEYNSLMTKIAQITANESGNLLTRDINTVIKEYNNGKSPKDQFKPIESLITQDTKAMITEYNSTAPTNQQFTHYLTNLFAVVPKNEQKNWLKSYETLADDIFVVPGSSLKLAEDSESAMFSVVVFTKDIENFKNLCRSRRITVRKNDPTTIINEEEKNKLKKELQKTKSRLERFTVSNFTEAFTGWLHLKSIQCFVESILRYGLPPDFSVILILPKKGGEKKLIKFLCKHYGYLGGGFNDAEDDVALGNEEKNVLGNEKFFPFVHVDITLALS